MRPRMLMAGLIACLVAAFCVGLSSPVALGAPDGNPTPEPTAKPARDILLGSLQRYRNGAVVDVRASFDVIPEWQAIEDRGLTPEDADYYVLLAQANETFYNALRAVSRNRGYDMIARKGAAAVQGLGLPEITSHVVDQITGN